MLFFLNFLLFASLILTFYFFNLKKFNLLIFYTVNVILILYSAYNYINIQNILVKEFSPFYNDPISIYLIFLTALISITCGFWITNSTFWKEMIVIILITEVCLLQIFSTKNLLNFYIFFELSALPLMYLITVRGPTFRRSVAFKYFLGYTLLGSIFFFIGLSIIFISFKTINLQAINLNELNNTTKTIVWLCFLLTFFVKIPVLPFHLWLLEAHVEAPTMGSVILAALLLKIGGYGLIRFCICLFPEVSFYWSPIIIGITILSALYSSFSAFIQLDAKRIIAYSSIAHMNIGVAGLFSFDFSAIYGSIINMLAHGYTSAGLFFLIGMLYKRFHTKNIIYYSGLANFLPIFHFFLFFFIFSNVAFPGTFNFVCELLILFGLNSWSSFLCFVFLITNGILFLYCVLLLTKICYSEVNSFFTELIDLNKYETLILTILVFLTLLFGIFPEFFLKNLEYSIKILYLKLR